MKTTLPVINLNGTDGATLVEWHYRVLKALRDITQLMTDVEPHGRDYPGKSELYQQARKEHVYRMNQLAVLVKEYRDLYEGIAEQQNQCDEMRELARRLRGGATS